MALIRVLWDQLIKPRLETGKDMDRDIRLILMALKDIDSRISDLEEEHNEIVELLKPKESKNKMDFDKIMKGVTGNKIN